MHQVIVCCMVILKFLLAVFLGNTLFLFYSTQHSFDVIFVRRDHRNTIFLGERRFADITIERKGIAVFERVIYDGYKFVQGKVVIAAIRKIVRNVQNKVRIKRTMSERCDGDVIFRPDTGHFQE